MKSWIISHMIVYGGPPVYKVAVLLRCCSCCCYRCCYDDDEFIFRSQTGTPLISAQSSAPLIFSTTWAIYYRVVTSRSGHLSNGNVIEMNCTEMGDRRFGTEAICCRTTAGYGSICPQKRVPAREGQHTHDVKGSNFLTISKRQFILKHDLRPRTTAGIPSLSSSRRSLSSSSSNQTPKSFRIRTNMRLHDPIIHHQNWLEQFPSRCCCGRSITVNGIQFIYHKVYWGR